MALKKKYGKILNFRKNVKPLSPEQGRTEKRMQDSEDKKGCVLSHSAADKSHQQRSRHHFTHHRRRNISA